MSVILKSAIAAAAVAIVGVEVLSHKQAAAQRPVAPVAAQVAQPALQPQAAAPPPPPPLHRATPSPMQMFRATPQE